MAVDVKERRRTHIGKRIKAEVLGFFLLESD
jgi:hypothetical protein